MWTNNERDSLTSRHEITNLSLNAIKIHHFGIIVHRCDRDSLQQHSHDFLLGILPSPSLVTVKVPSLSYCAGTAILA